MIVFDSFFSFYFFTFLLFCFFTFLLFVALSYKLCYNIFCWHGANKTQRPFERIFFIRSFFYCWCSNVFAIISIMNMMESLVVLDNEPQKELYLLLIGAVLAFVTSFFRLCKVRKSFFVKLSDSLICSLISLSTYFLIKQFHPIEPEFAIAIGSWVGYLGVDGIKTILLDRWRKEWS